MWVCRCEIPASHNRAALLLLLLLAGGGGDTGAGEAADNDGGSTGAAGCSKGCAASQVQGVVLLSLKENKNFISTQISEKLLMTMSQCCGSGMFIPDPGS